MSKDIYFSPNHLWSIVTKYTGEISSQVWPSLAKIFSAPIGHLLIHLIISNLIINFYSHQDINMNKIVVFPLH